MSPARPTRDPVWTHLALLLALSAGYESLQLHHGFNPFDEGWPAYAAMRLRAGGALYGDVFFPFPPAYLLPAWIAYALDPPGIILSRVIYAAFNTLACLGLYLVGRRLMTPAFALLGALLLAVAAPRGHWHQLLFGYRYMFFSMLALLCFDRRLRSGDSRWSVAAGAFAGVALCFSITPAFAVSCGVGVAIATADRDRRRWLRDWGAYALGLTGALALPLAWFASGVGLEAVWRQVVAHILVLQGAQSQPLPELALPAGWGDRVGIYRAFVALQYRLYPLLYAGYLAALAWLWIRARARRREFPHALLLAVVLWGGASLLRTLGRSDEPHLDSALPPACLLLAHAASLALHRLAPDLPARLGRTPVARAGWLLLALAAWSFLLGSDYQLAPERRGIHRIRAIPERVSIADQRLAQNLDVTITSIREWVPPGETILDLAAAPYLYVLTDRLGPGTRDIVMPGAFLGQADESGFVRRLESSPPAAVIWPRRAFDKLPTRNLAHSAPLVRRWVMQHYGAARVGRWYSVLLPLGSPQLSEAGAATAADADPGNEGSATIDGAEAARETTPATP